jgi:lactoylglutathione lyase
MQPKPRSHGLLRKVDCVQIPVPDLDSGLAFYRDRLGHELIWRGETAAGLRLADSDSEIVLQTVRPYPEVDFLVDSADQAVTELTLAGRSRPLPSTSPSDASPWSPTRSAIP